MLEMIRHFTLSVQSMILADISWKSTNARVSIHKINRIPNTYEMSGQKSDKIEKNIEN